MRAPRRIPWIAAASCVAAMGACSTPDAPCSAPTGGTFTMTLAYSQTLPVSTYCGPEDSGAPEAGPRDAAADTAPTSDAGVGEAGSCAGRAHGLEGATWTVSVSGSTATVTPKTGAAWSCTAVGPKSAPGGGPDGSTLPATGCYLLLSCGSQPAGADGAEDIQVQILAQSTTDVLVVARDESGACCTDEYTGSWH